MGIIKGFMGMPVHIKALAITIIGLVGLWILITPIYLEVLALNNSIPTYGWMIIGIGLILFAWKFGRAVL